MSGITNPDLRHRRAISEETRTSHKDNQGAKHLDSFRLSPTSVSTASSTPSTKRLTCRFCIVWTARILLPIVFLLSRVNFVMIPSHEHHHASDMDHSADLPIGHSSAVLVITHSRAEYLSRCLHSIMKHHPRGGPDNWRVFVSRDEQDGYHSELDAPIERAKGTTGVRLEAWHHNATYAPLDASDVEREHPGLDTRFINLAAYARISRHYKWALTQLFNDEARFQRVVIIEDDMHISSDLFDYFEALAPMLHTDPSLYCVSAWNDNGIKQLSLNASRMYRTDFFPGLGWMLTRQLWDDELHSKWPDLFWDDWLRSSRQRKNRQCIRPEVSRTSNFGEIGVSQSFHFDKHVSKVISSSSSSFSPSSHSTTTTSANPTTNNMTGDDTHTNFHSLDLSYLHNDTYFHQFFTQFSNATRFQFLNYLTTRPVTSDVIAFYYLDRMEPVGKRTGIMIDHREGVTRTSYHGVISIPWRGYTAFLVEKNWTAPAGYQLGARDCC